MSIFCHYIFISVPSLFFAITPILPVLVCISLFVLFVVFFFLFLPVTCIFSVTVLKTYMFGFERLFLVSTGNFYDNYDYMK